MEARYPGKLSAKIIAAPQTRFLPAKLADLHLTKGELLLDAAQLEVRSDFAKIKALKGALFWSSQFKLSYVRSPCAAGNVFVKVGGISIALNPGEVLLLTITKNGRFRNPSWWWFSLGRGNSQSAAIGNYYMTISEFAIIMMLHNSRPMSSLTSGDGSHKNLLARIIKTTASIDLLLKYKVLTP